MTMTYNEIRGASDAKIIARIKALQGANDWSAAQELALLKAEARKRGLKWD